MLRPTWALPAAALLAIAGCSRPLPTVTYACEAGDSIVAAFGERYAELHLPPDRVVRLPSVRAASGASYSDGRFTLRTKGTEAVLERGGTVVRRDCRTDSGAPVPDTALTPVLARQLIDSIDALAATMDSATRRLEPEARGWEPRVLRMWADSGKPLKLVVTEPDASGRMEGRSGYYFVDGRLQVVQGPTSQYIFRDTTLIFWSTDSLQRAVDLPIRDMVARQNFVLGEVRQYLAMFGLEP
ncbi:MAG TPA: MliC family protein [Gemmatimonadales bacterium]|nr:MliC family protein [Gemmatimonadales bacterium]